MNMQSTTDTRNLTATYVAQLSDLQRLGLEALINSRRGYVYNNPPPGKKYRWSVHITDEKISYRQNREEVFSLWGHVSTVERVIAHWNGTVGDDLDRRVMDRQRSTDTSTDTRISDVDWFAHPILTTMFDGTEKWTISQHVTSNELVVFTRGSDGHRVILDNDLFFRSFDTWSTTTYDHGYVVLYQNFHGGKKVTLDTFHYPRIGSARVDRVDWNEDRVYWQYGAGWTRAALRQWSLD